MNHFAILPKQARGARIRSVALFAVLAGLALLATAATAQFNSGDLIGAGTNGHLYQVSPSGQVTTHAMGLGVLGGWTMDYDNTSMLVADSSGGRLFLVGPDFVVTRIYAITHCIPVNLAVDANGNIFFTDLVSAGIMWFDATLGGFQPLVTGLSPELHGGLVVDLDTSDLLVTRGFGVVDGNPIYQVSRTTGAVTSIRHGVYGRFGMAQTADGSLWVGSCCAGSTPPRLLYRTERGSTLATARLTALPQTPIDGVQSLAADRASGPTDRLLFGAIDRQGLWIHDLSTGATTQRAAIDDDLFAVGFRGGRNLGAVRDGPRYWRLNVSFPGEAGRPYLVVLSYSGVRPPFTVAGARRIWITPDALTHLTVQGPIPPFVQRNLGVLNERDQAYPLLDLRLLPAAANGLRLWLVAATLDPAAPDGLATISDPMVLRIE